MKLKDRKHAYELQKNAVQNLLKVEKKLSRNCFLKKLGFTPDIKRLISDGVIRFVNGYDQFELVPEQTI